ACLLREVMPLADLCMSVRDTEREGTLPDTASRVSRVPPSVSSAHGAMRSVRGSYAGSIVFVPSDSEAESVSSDSEEGYGGRDREERESERGRARSRPMPPSPSPTSSIYSIPASALDAQCAHSLSHLAPLYSPSP
ncbi:hypothetical protein KIPB_015177, partial [Kipferlia bialata]